ncbi:hypothetical protein HG530_008305 [Fusarium avenaceum]|nr:hypothetical protein HG530_008305 [Fusarium avenaceum]
MGRMDSDGDGISGQLELLGVLAAKDVHLKLGKGAVGPSKNGCGRVAANKHNVLRSMDIALGANGKVVQSSSCKSVECSDLETILNLALEFVMPDVTTCQSVPSLHSGAIRRSDPVLPLSSAQEAAAIGDIVSNLLAPNNGTSAGVHGADNADVAECVKEARLILLSRSMEEGGFDLGNTDERVVEIDFADFVLENSCAERR